MDEATKAALNEIRLNKPRTVKIPGMEECRELVSGFTTRFGGVSEGPFASLNMNFFRDDPRENVAENFRLFSQDTGVAMENMVLSRQVHGVDILRVTEEHKGMGITRERSYGPVDGLATDIPGIMLVTYYADCVPIYLYDPAKRAICLSHSGWRGTLSDMAGASVSAMTKWFGSDPGDIRASLGPHIGLCCFEVDGELAEAFFIAFPQSAGSARDCGGGKWRLDLGSIIRESLVKHGINAAHIRDSGICTKCCHDIFFSHRGSGGLAGTGAAYLMMR